MANGWTIIYVHGMGSQPPPDVLKQQWDQALFGKPCDFSYVAYYADKRLPPPQGLTALDILSGKTLLDPVLGAVTKEFTHEFISDVNNYLYKEPIRDAILEAVTSVFEQFKDSKKVMVISHSLGTVVSYEVLLNLKMFVPTWITCGCPLGLDPLRASLREIRKVPVLPIPDMNHWLNYFDPFDIVAADQKLENDFNDKRIQDFVVRNPDRKFSGWFGFHEITGYLSVPLLRSAVAATLLEGVINQ